MSMQNKVVAGLQEAMAQGQRGMEVHVQAMQDLLTEIRDNQNRNFIWSMEAIQEICNKLDIKLRDPLEIESMESINELKKEEQ